MTGQVFLALDLKRPFVMEGPEPNWRQHIWGGDGADVLARIMGELQEVEHLCSALPECDASGKLRGKLARLDWSLRSFAATGDLSPFREDLRSARAFVEYLHSLEPLTQLLARLSALDRQLTDGDSHA